MALNAKEQSDKSTSTVYDSGLCAKEHESQDVHSRSFYSGCKLELLTRHLAITLRALLSVIVGSSQSILWSGSIQIRPEIEYS